MGVALGAFGAHALKVRLATFDTVEIWRTASLYHLLHAVTMLVISRAYASRKLAWWLFLAGVLVFSGSLYTLAVTDLKKLGMITPLGGLAFLGAWAALVFGKSED